MRKKSYMSRNTLLNEGIFSKNENKIIHNRLDPMVHRHFDDMMTEKAIEMIKDWKEEPFFMQLSFVSPHVPVISKNEHPQCSHIKSTTRRHYCENMQELDERVRLVHDTLEAEGMTENTMIWFLSDNGGHPFCGGFNYPLRGSKLTLYEGGVRVPSFLWGGGLPDFTFDANIHAVDVGKTIHGLLVTFSYFFVLLEENREMIFYSKV